MRTRRTASDYSVANSNPLPWDLVVLWKLWFTGRGLPTNVIFSISNEQEQLSKKYNPKTFFYDKKIPNNENYYNNVKNVKKGSR